MNKQRRAFLKGALATGGAMAFGTTVLPQSAMADWSEKVSEAFSANSIEDISKALFENDGVIEETNNIFIDAPPIAENGAVVPIEITADIPKVESIVIIGEKNPTPLIAQFNFHEPENAVAWVKTRIKMSETSHVVIVVKADGKLYAARRKVQITVGGCGG